MGTHMDQQPESASKLLSQLLLPFGQQWAASNGYPMLSKLLGDEDLHALVTRYGDSMLAAWAEAREAAAAKPGPRAEAICGDAELAKLGARLTAIEAQHQQLRTLLATVQIKMRPLAQALGCCPECLVGVEGCPACWGKSTVAANPPDLELLQARIVNPLAASGVPLQLNAATRRRHAVKARSQSRRDTGANHER
jgi:hypothetical protein